MVDVAFTKAERFPPARSVVERKIVCVLPFCFALWVISTCSGDHGGAIETEISAWVVYNGTECSSRRPA